MQTYDVQSIEIEAPARTVFEYLSRPDTLPEWAHAFRSVDGSRATLATPKGTEEVELTVETSSATGCVDWLMHFPDGSLARAHSRVVPGAGERSIYTFVLLAPPVPLEQVEGALAEQSRTLRSELSTLRRRLAPRA
jgi:hypothetical protein